VIGRLESEDVTWIDKTDLKIKKAICVVDNPRASPGFVVPKNKGHEAMVYLTYIIDHYDELSDTTIFMHPHRNAWHNNDLLDSDAYNTIHHMIDDHVARAGYFNTRCHHEPGCPDWLHINRPDAELDSSRKMEEESWHELHPGVEPPPAISQPCCAQFAVSRDRIRANPRSEYIRYREWLLNTSLDDVFSGRILEYSWQYIFAGVPEFCPAMHVCYCDGYGICFGGPQQLDDWMAMRNESRVMMEKANQLATEPNEGSNVRDLQQKIRSLQNEMEALKKAAFARGQDPHARAVECGRESIVPP
jgi:outer membrane murein-binding lipoprotein Lpp